MEDKNIYFLSANFLLTLFKAPAFVRDFFMELVTTLRSLSFGVARRDTGISRSRRGDLFGTHGFQFLPTTGKQLFSRPLSCSITLYFPPNKNTILKMVFLFGAGNGNRTRISSLARTYKSHYTIPAKCLLIVCVSPLYLYQI